MVRGETVAREARARALAAFRAEHDRAVEAPARLPAAQWPALVAARAAPVVVRRAREAAARRRPALRAPSALATCSRMTTTGTAISQVSRRTRPGRRVSRWSSRRV